MRVTVTIPLYMEKHFERLSDELGLSKQDTFLHLLTESVARNWSKPPVPTAELPERDFGNENDLYMLAAPERLKVYTFSDPGSCLRGEEIGEYHKIEAGDKYAWQKFSRHSKDGFEGWETGKNGKLCEACQPIALELWFSGSKNF